MSPELSRCQAVCAQLRRYQRLVVTSHVRPDGDAVGSSLALAQALTALGKSAQVILRDPAPDPLTEFPGVETITLAAAVPADTEAVVVLECGDLDRTGLSGLDHCEVVNVDHHQGNNGYGHVHWFDPSYAAVGEMVFEIIEALGAPMTAEMATLLYVAIVTDTGSFRHPGTSPRTFAISGRLVAAGADPVLTARRLYDSNSVSRVRLQGAVLQTLDVEADGRIALLELTAATLAATGAAADDTEGIINIPLSIKSVQVALFFKATENGNYRVSLRSKGSLDVGAVARGFGGGGHLNASGCTVPGPMSAAREAILGRLLPILAAEAAGGAAGA